MINNSIFLSVTLSVLPNAPLLSSYFIQFTIQPSSPNASLRP